MALTYGLDLDALVFNKITVQNIYNANYNFSKPPYTPRVNAVAGDHKVYLYWDDPGRRDRAIRSSATSTTSKGTSSTGVRMPSSTTSN